MSYCAWHLGEQIERHRRWRALGVRFGVFLRWRDAAGKAGAIRAALPNSVRAFLCYGDSYLACDSRMSRILTARNWADGSIRNEDSGPAT